jgi:chorismate synthase
MMSLPATKAFEIGSGFAGTRMRGSEHNDAYYMEGDRVRTSTNRSGGIQGGISNGEPIVFRIGFKPTATIFKAQQTVTQSGEDTELTARGRHDPVRPPPRRPDGRGHGRPHPLRPRPAAARAAWVVETPSTALLLHFRQP